MNKEKKLAIQTNLVYAGIVMCIGIYTLISFIAQIDNELSHKIKNRLLPLISWYKNKFINKTKLSKKI